MLYILPPPRAPDPPSPWDSILCAGTGNTTSGADRPRPPWTSSSNTSNSKIKRPPKARLRAHLIIRNDDSVGCGQDELDTGRSSKSLSECYFAGKGAALVLPAAEAQKSSRRSGSQGYNIQKHLQSMFYLLRPEETLKMAVKLESVHPNRTRYLVVVSRMGRRAEESCLLGIDCNEKTTVGLVLRVLADTTITLDGDGGFSVSVCGRHHIFKPVSVQAMWSALQTLHKVSSKARAENYYQGGLTHSWVSYYEDRIESDRSCLNEWHAMDNLESRRPPSPDSVRNKPMERDETEKVIRSTLKEIMMSVDLDEVTSKYIRSRLEEDLDMDLGEYKSFIDEEMLVILGQMDAPTEIFDHVYLGSEWNASNYEELQRNGVGHILNVTREIDNFFPGTFDYLNIRVYDDEKTDLLKHWDNTFKYISKAKKDGSKVLVHCKMGVSRSASVVIAYAMKAYNWDFKKALQHVKDKRNCIKPNTNFLQQLEMYQGMLDAMKNKEKLQRSKSETNLKSPGATAKTDKVLVGSEPTPMIQALARSQVLETIMSGQELRQIGSRPKSWSPDNLSETSLLLESKSPPTFRSLENLIEKSVSKESLQSLKEQKKSNNSNNNNNNKESLATNVLLPCDNGESYSVSPNRIVHLPGQTTTSSLVKERVNELESTTHYDIIKSDKKKLVLNLTTTQFEVTSMITDGGSKSASPEAIDDSSFSKLEEEDAVKAQTKLTPPMLRAVLVKKEIWDPGEQPPSKVSYCNGTSDACDLHSSVVNEKQTVWTSSTVLMPVSDSAVLSSSNNNNSNSNKVPELQARSKTLPTTRKEGDPFSNQLDRVFDREERKQQRVSVIPVLPACVAGLSNEVINRECPSRQSSWSSYDSAVVLGYQGETRDAPSRHSSWGSGDTRTLPSRNSSWGSYDMRPTGPVHYINEKGEKVLHSDLLENSSSGMFPYDKEDIPWYPGTVKRTKQKLEESSTGKVEGTSDNLTNSSDAPSDTVQSDLAQTPLEAFNTVLINNRCALNVQNHQLYVNNNQSAIMSSKLDVVADDDQKYLLSRLSVSAPETSSMELVAQECSLSRSASNVSTMGKLSRDASSSVISTTQCSSVKQHRTFLENFYNKDNVKVQRKCEDTNETTDQTSNILGKVRNLKKEFEAKTNVNIIERSSNQTINSSETNDTLKVKSRGNSMPSSPISIHQEKETKGDVSPTSSEPGDFKKLICKFEVKDRTNQESQVTVRSKQSNKPLPNKNSRYSCFEVSIEKNPPVRITQTPLITNYNKNSDNNKNGVDGEFKRPPIPPVVRNTTAPSVVVATVIAKAAKKQQQYGKSHPLARLNIKPRHNSPVYNTM